MTLPELRPLSIGEVLDQSFGLYRRHFATLAMISVVVGAVPLVLDLYVQASGGLLARPIMWLSGLMLMVVLSAIGTAATVFVVSESYLGRTTAASEALSRAGPYILRLILLSIMTSLVVFIGWLFLLVPGMIFATALIVSTQALVLEEDRSAIEAMGRSWRLTKGHRWRMFALIVVIFILIFIPAAAGFVVAAMFTVDLTALNPADLPLAWYAATILGRVAQMLLYPLMYSVLTVAYYDLRVRKEGFDLDVLAQALEAN